MGVSDYIVGVSDHRVGVNTKFLGKNGTFHGTCKDLNIFAEIRPVCNVNEIVKISVRFLFNVL